MDIEMNPPVSLPLNEAGSIRSADCQLSSSTPSPMRINTRSSLRIQSRLVLYQQHSDYIYSCGPKATAPIVGAATSSGLSTRSMRKTRKVTQSRKKDLFSYDEALDNIKVRGTARQDENKFRMKRKSAKTSKYTRKKKSGAKNVGRLFELEDETRRNTEEYRKSQKGECKVQEVSHPRAFTFPSEGKQAYSMKFQALSSKKSLMKSKLNRKKSKTQRKSKECTSQNRQELICTESVILALRRGLEDKDGRAEFMRSLMPLLKTEDTCSDLTTSFRSMEEQEAFLGMLDTLALSPEDVNVMAFSQVRSLSWHPSSARLVLAAGDNLGNIGFWDLDHKKDAFGGVRVYDVHTSPVYSMSFDISDPSRLWSTSLDFVHSLDLNRDSFSEVYSAEITSDTVTTYHIQKDPSTLLISQSNGEVVAIDIRADCRDVMRVKCYHGTICTLSKHPLNDNLFLAASSRNGMGVFDIRRLTTQPVTSFLNYPVTVQSASFSPISGRLVLTNSGNHSIYSTTSIYDVQAGPVALHVSTVRHNNLEYAVRSSWHPHREDVFVTGGVFTPEAVSIFDVSSGQAVYQLKSDYLNTMCYVNSFHPSIPVMACSNRYGRVHVFRSPRNIR